MLWSGVSEPFGVANIRCVQSELPLFDDLFGPAIMQHFRSKQADPAVVVLLIVPREDFLAICARVLDGAVALRKIRHVLEPQRQSSVGFCNTLQINDLVPAPRW